MQALLFTVPTVGRHPTISGVGRSIIGGRGGGRGDIHIFVFTDLKNNRFQTKVIMQNTNIYIYIYIYISAP